MPRSQSRHRKVAILTVQGFQKLETVKSKADFWNHYTKSCTLEALSEQTGLSPHTLSKVHARKAAVDLRTLVRYFSAFDLILEPGDYMFPARTDKTTESDLASSVDISLVKESFFSGNTVSWGMAPDVSAFYGRITELNTLKEWILEHQCRLIALLGMAGIGKTWLATRLTEEVQHTFKFTVWRSLQPIARSHSPLPFCDLLDDLIRHLDPQFNPIASASIGAKVRQLMETLRRIPCLLVLDNVECILPEPYCQTGMQANAIESYGADHDAYGELFRQLAQGRHQSCVVLTSRAEPKPIQSLMGNALGVRSLSLKGLHVADVQKMLSARGIFQGTPDEWSDFVDYYGGNPLFLGIVATTIQCLFDGSITNFFSQNTLMLEEIFERLEQQLSSLSEPEQAVFNILATQDKPLLLSELQSQIVPSISTKILLETLTFLKTRSLINTAGAEFSLPPLLRDYVRVQDDLVTSSLRL